MANENKNKKSGFWPPTLNYASDRGKYLSIREARKLKHPDDPDVRILEKKNKYIRWDSWHEGETYKDTEKGGKLEDRSWYLYEPHARYKRTENPDYARYKGYSLSGILAGTGLLVTGLISGNLPFAYAGAALALTSVGGLAGCSRRRWAIDQMFEKVPWPEEKVQEKLKEAKAEAKDKGLYQSLKRWIIDKKDTIFYTNYHIRGIEFTKGPWCEDRWRLQAKEPKDEGLYIRRTYQSRPLCSPGPFSDFAGLEWNSFEKPKLGHRSGTLETSALALALGLPMFIAGGLLGFMPLIYAAAATPLYPLGHTIGFLLSKNKAEPEYQKVGGLEEKVKATQSRGFH